MTDVLTPNQRRRNMQAIRSADTKPEMLVRSLVHRMGYRFRLHHRDLPGRPDLVFPSRRKVIFVHGCFWHQHPGCRYATRPATRPEFWATKLDGNRERDQKVLRELHQLGWDVAVIWECQTKNLDQLRNTLRGFLRA
ncbi:very short patch repair endonuclease [Mucisphaera sp.]|uniref:very short patch repair endonuclease n=1 Tax=Mucisphaera sp. TaxID=2913024 RepID=UPI003D122004